MPDPASHDPLQPLREQIDALDAKLVELLNERAQVVVEVGKVKRSGQTDTPIYAPDRERAVLDRVRSLNQGPLPDACLEAIWREMMSGSFALERPLRIGYLGPAGSFSHLAARRQFGASVDYDELADFAAIFDEVARGHIDYGLVPIENSTHGGVTASLDCFLDTEVKVCAEVLLAVHHNLVSRHKLADIERVLSHPQALGQCKRWLAAQLPRAQRVDAASSSHAVRALVEAGPADPPSAAIASRLAAQLYDVPILYENIEDNPNNTTRFFVIGKQSPKPTADDKTAILFTTEHKPGALTDVLTVFRDAGVNISRLAERPSQRQNWEYYFFIDVDGHADDDRLAATLDEARQHCLQLTTLGSFPRAKDVLS
ncbi:MAG: prephenate dehydratase [Planctomycetota bacterium]